MPIVEDAVPTGIDQCFGIFMGMATADAGEGLRTLLSMVGTERTHPLLSAVLSLEAEQKSAGFLHGLWVQVDMYRSAMLSFFQNYDLILCPVNALPAVEHGTSFRNDVLPASYTIAFNLTGWPGAVVRGSTSSEGLRRSACKLSRGPGVRTSRLLPRGSSRQHWAATAAPRSPRPSDKEEDAIQREHVVLIVMPRNSTAI